MKSRGVFSARVAGEVVAGAIVAFRSPEISAANAGAYPDFPEEIQLLWYKELLQINREVVKGENPPGRPKR